MRVHLLLLSLYIVSLQLQTAEVVRGGEEEENIDPFELARQLRAEICAINKSQIKEFYKAQRDEENRDSQFPEQEADVTRTQRAAEISWTWRPVTRILQPFLGKRLDNTTLNLFTWCIFPLSTTTEIYGCINSTDRWGSPGFRALGLLDIMSLKNISANRAYKKGRLVIETSKNPHLSVLKGALVSCTITVPDNSTIGIYYELDLVLSSKQSTLVGISSQADAFLIEGRQKNFTCESVGDDAFGHRWYKKTANGQYNLICNTDFTKVEENCNHTLFYQLIFREEETPGCEFTPVHTVRHRKINNTLVFDSPTVSDTGEILCNSDNRTSVGGRSIYIAVVFTKLPEETINIKEGSSSLLTCEMKAPSDSVVYWAKKQIQNVMCQTPFLNESSSSDTAIKLCSTTAVVNKTVEKVDEVYSIFHLELQIPQARFEHSGVYSCNVKYKIGSMTEPQLIEQQSNVLVIEQDAMVGRGGGLSKSQITMAAVIGSFIFCFLVGASITLILIVWVRNVKRNKRGRKIARLSKGRLSIRYGEVNLLSPGVMKFHQFEFPRSNLELQDIIGEGRFGKVYKGKAYGIVPDAPDLNTVAVKTTATDQLHACTQLLLSELEILTKIHPHENICNLLASCTSPDGPLYIIMEYAYHGNLKDYLEMCKQTLLQRNIPTRIVSETERSHFRQLLINCDSEDSETNSPSDVTEALQFTVPNPVSCDPELNLRYDHLLPADQESPCALDGDQEAVMWSTGYDRLLSKESSNFDDSALDDIVCGDAAFNCLITEQNVCDFARQIASGLQHLEDMKIVHCDLAARNIVIAEGFLLKIADFGMARCMASDARYQRLQSNEGSMVAVKWAALEVLEKEIYSFKSDIWSFAIIIWEIATYGSKPFAGFAIGASLEPFIQHLNDGNRLPQPDGLNDSIYADLCSCWSADPNTRPSASTLMDYFKESKESTDSLV